LGGHDNERWTADADHQRELIQARTADGLARAKAKGVKFGRKRALSDTEAKAAAKAYSDGMTLAELAIDYECSEATMSRIIRPRSSA
jgi:DNA invertase Pin-like site-specific DNA recombinase